MGRMFAISTGFQTVSAAQDLLEIQVPATEILVLHSITISQSSDEASSESELLQVALKRASGSYTSGSGGSSATPAKLEFGSASTGLTVERNNTSQAAAGSGALTTIHEDAMQVLSGWNYTPTPEIRPILSPSQALVVSIEAPADALTLCCIAIVEEIGG